MGQMFLAEKRSNMTEIISNCKMNVMLSFFGELKDKEEIGSHSVG